MKRILTNIFLALSILFGAFDAIAKQTYVKGYTRKDGTYVRPHYRNTGGSTSAVKTSRSTVGSTKPVVKTAPNYPNSYKIYQQRQTQGPRTFSKEMREQKYKEQGGRCPHCGGVFAFSQMEGDHVTPYSKGGKTEYSNLQMLCAPCNRKKSNKYNW